MIVTQSVFLSLIWQSSLCLASIFSWAVKYFFIASLFLAMLERIGWCWSGICTSTRLPVKFCFSRSSLMCKAFVQSNHWSVFTGVIGRVGKKAVIRLWTSLLVNLGERREAFKMRVRRPASILTMSSLGIFSMATGWLIRKDLRAPCRVYKKE